MNRRQETKITLKINTAISISAADIDSMRTYSASNSGKLDLNNTSPHKSEVETNRIETSSQLLTRQCIIHFTPMATKPHHTRKNSQMSVHTTDK